MFSYYKIDFDLKKHFIWEPLKQVMFAKKYTQQFKYGLATFELDLVVICEPQYKKIGYM